MIRTTVFSLIVCIAAVFLTACSFEQPLTRQNTGNLDISFEVEGAEPGKQYFPRLYIDDRYVGNISPSKPILNLKKGTYMMRVELDGYRTWRNRLYVYGKTSRQAVHVTLRPR